MTHKLSKTQKRIMMNWLYGVSPFGLAKRYDWRTVQVVMRHVFTTRQQKVTPQ